MSQKTIIYVDLDDTLCDYKGAYDRVKEFSPDLEFPQSMPGFYENLSPLPDAVNGFNWLCNQTQFEVYILTAPSIHNPHCYTEKRLWVEKHLGFEHVHRLIISYHKNLLLGDYLIDDRVEGRGQESFTGELLQFGSCSRLDTWREIKRFITKKLIKNSLAGHHRLTQHPEILCFRAFDMRDRFPSPVPTFKAALELLQSDRAYLPELSGEIVCYLKTGDAITVPNSFFINERKDFASIEEATAWVNERAKDPAPHLGLAVANPDLPIDEQIQEAMLSTETFIIPSSENPNVCVAVNEWLNQFIDALLNEKISKDKTEEFERLFETLSMKDYQILQSPKETEASETEYAETIAFFKARFDDLKNPKRWVITSRDCALTDITGNAYFDVVNDMWVSRISDATCIKDKNIADAIIASFGEENDADLVQHYVSQKELAKTAVKLENDPAVIYYHSETDTYLYEECNRFSDYETHALIALNNPDQYTLQKLSKGSNQLFVSIPDIAMDALAIAWCKHRKIKRAFD